MSGLGIALVAPEVDESLVADAEVMGDLVQGGAPHLGPESLGGLGERVLDRALEVGGAFVLGKHRHACILALR